MATTPARKQPTAGDKARGAANSCPARCSQDAGYVISLLSNNENMYGPDGFHDLRSSVNTEQRTDGL